MNSEQNRMDVVITNYTIDALEDLGKEIIKQKAIDVAKQVEIYIRYHPNMTLQDLKNDERFREISVQPVGETGYTAIVDANQFVIILHKFPGQEGKDLTKLKDSLPSFWKVIEPSAGGKQSSGYYDWKELDNSTRKKYAFIEPINATTADGKRGLTLWATTYIDEFSKPMSDIIEKIQLSKNETTEKIKTLGNQSLSTSLLIFSILSIIAAVIGFLLTKTLSNPIIRLTNASNELGKGNLDVKVDIKSKDEIGMLAKSFNQMAADLERSRNEIKKHSEELEKVVSDRTGELDTKLRELGDNRTAILNMMEDSEEANRQLMKVQKELKKAVDELKKTDVKKDEFISITAHEFKTPLTAIHGFAQLLQGKKIDRESMQKYLRIMMEETDRLAKLVTEILDLSRMDLGTFKFNFEAADLAKLVDDVSNEIKEIAGKKGLKLRYSISPGVPKQITTDPERLRQVLINLVINAVKYTPKGSIELKVAKEHGELKFSVKDTGIGIPKEEIPKLFHRFYQIDSSYTRETKGSGLGLALCKEIVQGMGGKIWMESEAGRGSTFHFTLPFKPKINRGQANKL
ncbi:MAG: ATP-binding protein [Candidatus Aenigmarchaeota archaeon]|nr:ATP-binding protein [Candidatus Aenigmarchaeota archaeon]